MKMYADTKNKAKSSDIMVGDKVFMKQKEIDYLYVILIQLFTFYYQHNIYNITIPQHNTKFENALNGILYILNSK